MSLFHLSGFAIGIGTSETCDQDACLAACPTRRGPFGSPEVDTTCVQKCLVDCGDETLTRGKAATQPLAVSPPQSVTIADWPAEWSHAVSTAVLSDAPELLQPGHAPRDVALLCPGFATATREQKLVFWDLFFASLAQVESQKHPDSCFREAALSDKKNNDKLLAQFNAMSPPKKEANQWLAACHEPRLYGDIYSEGLLQESFSDRAIYGCPFASLKDVRVPTKNLECGVRIMNKQIGKYGVLFTSENFYWSTLKTGNTHEDSLVRHFRRYGKSLTFCPRSKM